jgi:energy-coupling factor transporter ATP-binding protein EcfA2
MIRPAGPASELLARECEWLAAREDLRGEQVLDEIVEQCRQPVRVMIAGDVSSGKSTLVNALLGRKMAATGRAEVTSEVTWYRHPALAGARLPAGPHRAVELAFPLADRLMLVDTPGLNTVSGQHLSTLRLLSVGDGSGVVAALVYLIISELLDAGYQRLAEFTAPTAAGLGNIVVVAGKAETVNEPPEQTERRIRAKDVPVRVVAVSQHLAMVARCGAITSEHVDIARLVLADTELRRFATYGWAQLDPAWAARGRSPEALAPLRALVPALGWLVTALPDAPADLDVPTLAACCEHASRLQQLESILGELADDGDLLTATVATERLRSWASRRGQQRGDLITGRLATLWQRSEFAVFPRRRAALLLSTSAMADIPDTDRAVAIALLRGQQPPDPEPSWPEFARRWHRRANSTFHGVLAADVAQIVATTVSRYLSTTRKTPCSNSC